MNSPFVLKPEEYKRDVDLLGCYIKDSATYLAKMSGKDYESCKEFVVKNLKPGGKFEFKDPRILYLEREENGDRDKKVGHLYEYIRSSLRNQELIAPTLTTYLNPKQSKSFLVDFIDFNIKARGVAKKAMFAAEMAGDKDLYIIKKNEQNNRKISNNSISGAHVSPSTPIYNKTAHSTLTSNCRSTSGYGNANNEKFLCGNRHYWSPAIVKNNIISIINNSNYDLIREAMCEFNIRHPSVDETMECIEYSARLYWRDEFEYAKLRSLIERLTDIERSAFVYTGDLYHLMKYNDAVVKDFIGSLSMRVEDTSIEDPTKVIKSEPEENLNLAVQICEREMKGKTVKEIVGQPIHSILAATTRNIRLTSERFAKVIHAFWVTPNVPASVAHFPESIRRAALTSDTDSTIFTVESWVKWYCGEIVFTERANAVAATMIWLAASTITHVLARMSANFGIETERIHQIAMKNEFKFDVFVPTQVAKHYFALIGCQEGNLFSKYKKEIKGVHLKSSNAPREVIEEADKMMTDIMNSVLEGKKISIMEMLKRVADQERKIFADLNKGGHFYFRRNQIKPPESYSKDSMSSNYIYYSFWNDVFGPKYGLINEPPYVCLKLSTEIDSAKKTTDWINSIQDKELSVRLITWMKKYKKAYIGSLMLPEQIISSIGIPAEITPIIGSRKIVSDACSVFYLILETLGVYINRNETDQLISDFY